MDGLHSFVAPLDWAVVGTYLAAVSLLAWCTRGKPESHSDYFLAGRTLPWPLAAASVAATELGIVAFLVVPAAMLEWQGDGTRLQWVLGAIAARVILAVFFVKRACEGGHESPYDFIGARIGGTAKTLSVSLFWVGGVIAHSARLLLAATVLATVTPLPLAWSLFALALLVVLWAVPGGIRTVAWTNAANLGIFAAAGAAALWWTVEGLEGGWGTLFETVRTAERFDGTPVDKLNFLDFRFSPDLEFTFWTALFAAPFLQVSALGVDHTFTQALLSCRGASEARKAVWWSSLGQTGILLMTFVGLALFVFYQRTPPTDPFILKALRWSGGAPSDAGAAFPVWFVTEMPAGFRGLLLAGLVAATVPAVGSFVMARAQLGRERWKPEATPSDRPSRHRREVAFCAAGVCGVAFGMFLILLPSGSSPLMPASRVADYTAGPLLAVFLCALAGRGRAAGLLIGTMLSMLVVALSQRDLIFLEGNEFIGAVLVRIHAAFATGSLATVGELLVSPWAWPITTLLTFACGWDWRRKLSQFS